MPQSPNPPFVVGAISIPRTLNRWLDKNYLRGPLKRTQTYLVMPAFNVSYVWQGYSDIVASFNFEAPNNFSLTGFLSGTPAQQQAVIGQQVNQFNPGLVPQVPSLPVLPTLLFPSTYGTPNYFLCISWRTVSGIVHRYALWNNVGEVLYFPSPPLYTGQLIKKNFRLEVWSTAQGSPAVQANPVYLYTSVRGQVDYRFGLDTPLAGSDGLQTNFSVGFGGSTQIIPVGVHYTFGLYTINTITGHTYQYGNGGNSLNLFNGSDTHNPGDTFIATSTTYELLENGGTGNDAVVASLIDITAGAFSLPFIWPIGSYSQPNPDDNAISTVISGSQVPALPSGGGTIIYSISSTQIVEYSIAPPPNPPNVNLPAIAYDPDGILPNMGWNTNTKQWT